MGESEYAAEAHEKRQRDKEEDGEVQETSAPGTEPVEATAPEASAAPAAAAPPLAKQPTRQIGGSRLSIAIAALVLIVVVGVIATLVFGR